MRPTLFVFLLPLGLLAQLTTDDFEDGNLLNPDWTGDTAAFAVVDGRLRLSATEEGPARLALFTPTNANAETLAYELLVEMDFAPSASNFATVVLEDDRTDFGIVELRFGGISGSEDGLEVSFIDAEGMVSREAIGRAGALGTQPAVVRFRLTRTVAAGGFDWRLETDYSGGRDFTQEFELTIPFKVSPNVFRIQADFTPTRSDRFSFDDLLVRSEGEVVGPEPRPLGQPTARNLLINEFLVDPNPPVGPPQPDFVELFNAGDSTLDLNRVRITSGPDSRGIVVDTLEPGAYHVASVLPALNVTNDNVALLLGADTLHNLNYDRSWYGDEDRDDGGYSLEFVGGDFGTLDCPDLWRASLAPDGSTPGEKNSVDSLGADAGAIVITDKEVTATTIMVRLSKAVTVGSLNPSDYVLTGGVSVRAVRQLDDRTIELTVELEEGIVYELALPPVLTDCAGNTSDFLDCEILIPADPQPGDIAINELLFDPPSGGSDYLELINCTELTFDLRGFVLRNEQSTSSTSRERTVNESIVIRPGEYLVLTADRDFVLDNYRQVHGPSVRAQTLPSLPNEAGNVSLIAPDGTVIDAFDYSEDLHSSLIDTDGVALERLRKTAPTSDPANWFSAASTEEFGTPTRANSQDRNFTAPDGEANFTLVSPTFSPDGDGFEDVLEIAYDLDGPGPDALARLTIFDVQGRLIRNLNRVELLAASGTLRWDGTTDDGERADAGAYVILCELFFPDGRETIREKLVGVLAGAR